MTYARAFGNSVVLPNGKVFVTGGQPYPVPFTDTNAVLTPELWDPASQTFTILPPETNPRTYHSVALLMLDGRVFSGGGGLCGDCTTVRTVTHFRLSQANSFPESLRCSNLFAIIPLQLQWLPRYSTSNLIDFRHIETSWRLFHCHSHGFCYQLLARQIWKHDPYRKH